MGIENLVSDMGSEISSQRKFYTSFITFSTNHIIFKSMNHFYNFLNADMKQ